MMNFVLNTRNFVFKMMNFAEDDAPPPDELLYLHMGASLLIFVFLAQHKLSSHWIQPWVVSKSDEFCIENEKFCINNEKLCIKNEKIFFIKKDEFCSTRADYT